MAFNIFIVNHQSFLYLKKKITILTKILVKLSSVLSKSLFMDTSQLGENKSKPENHYHKALGINCKQKHPPQSFSLAVIKMAGLTENYFSNSNNNCCLHHELLNEAGYIPFKYLYI